MAKCDEGYRCDICGSDVDGINVSDLYLRYVLGEVDPLRLPFESERHLRCNPALAQYIVDPRFEKVTCEGIFAKINFDANYVREEEERVTRGWQRLQEIPKLGIPIPEYPIARWNG